MQFTDKTKINEARLWESLMEMAKIGPGVAGGNNRQALTDADGAGRALLRRWCEAAGMEVGVDRAGNMFAVRPGADPRADEDAAALPVYAGSHLDTQPTGGKFDGVLGVLAALEAARTLNDCAAQTRHPVAVVNWTNEEGCRFAPPLFGSGVFCGAHPLAWAEAQQDAAGKTFGAELARIGWRGAEAPGARKMRAYFELHIEQGPVLEAAGVDIGAVTHGQGMHWLEFTLTGRESHAGSTPLAGRADAGRGAARIIAAVREVAAAHSPQAVGTVGHCEVFPNSPNIIPGKAVLTADFRHPEKNVLAAMKRELTARAEAAAAAENLQIAIRETGHYPPVAFDPACVAAVRGAAARLGYACRDIVSGAGHDAFSVARVAPAAMIMCPCAGGLSHNEAESITPAQAAAGANVLLHAVVDTAELV